LILTSPWCSVPTGGENDGGENDGGENNGGEHDGGENNGGENDGGGNDICDFSKRLPTPGMGFPQVIHPEYYN